jgi:hypothetical protein
MMYMLPASSSVASVSPWWETVLRNKAKRGRDGVSGERWNVGTVGTAAWNTLFQYSDIPAFQLTRTVQNKANWGPAGPECGVRSEEWASDFAKQSQSVLPDVRCARHTLRAANKADSVKQSQIWEGWEIWRKGPPRGWWFLPENRACETKPIHRSDCGLGNARAVVRNKANCQGATKSSSSEAGRSTPRTLEPQVMARRV